LSTNQIIEESFYLQLQHNTVWCCRSVFHLYNWKICVIFCSVQHDVLTRSLLTSYSNTLIGTLAVDELTVTFGTARGLDGLRRCTNCDSPPVNSVPILYYSMWH